MSAFKYIGRPVPLPPGVYSSPDRGEITSRLRKEIERCEVLASALGEVVHGITKDFDVAERFEKAFASWLTDDAREQIAKIEAQPEIPTFKYATPERMIELTERRNKLVEQLGLMDEQVRNIRNMNDDGDNPFATAMAPALELQIQPFRDQLGNLESEISAIQKELEAEVTSASNDARPSGDQH